MAQNKKSEHISLQVKEDMVFQRRQWLFERLSWVLMLLIVIGAIAGLFGEGLWSETHKQNTTIAVSYDTFARKDAPTSVTVSLKGGSKLVLDQTFLRSYKVESIHPEPAETTYGEGKIHYSFSSTQNAQNQEIVFRLQPNDIGVIKKLLGTEKEGGVTLHQIVYP